MAVLTLSGGRFIDDHSLAGHFLGQFVAVQAGDILVGAIEGIPRPRIVIELRGFPACGVMTAGAVGSFRPGSELVRMDVVMAPGAQLRSSCEIHVLQGHFHNGWTMTINAGDPAVRARQREFRRRVVEARQFLPLPRCVTRLATRNGAVRQLGLHLRAEFAPMRILVTHRAGPIVESELHWSHRTLRHFLVAVRTGDG